MTAAAVSPLINALASCEQVDVSRLGDGLLGGGIVDLRRAAARLEAEIARWVHAANVAEVWKAAGATSMETWLASATQSTVGTARRGVRLAATIAAAPEVGAALRDGSLSVDNAQLLSTILTPEQVAAHTTELLEYTTGAPSDTKKALELFRSLTDATGEDDREAKQRDRRTLRFAPTDDGMVAIHALLTAEDAHQVKLALGHIAGAAYDDHSGRSSGQRWADAFTELCAAYNAGSITGGRERPTLLATVPFDTITERAAHRGTIVGTEHTLSAEAMRRLACDADIHRVITDGKGVVLNFGAATRLASHHQYLAMALRDDGCRWPGCHRPPGWCQAHHIDEVHRDNGPTDIHNMVLLCSAHHHEVHARHWNLVGDANDLTIRHVDGRVLDAPARGVAGRTSAVAA